MLLLLLMAKHKSLHHLIAFYFQLFWLENFCHKNIFASRDIFCLKKCQENGVQKLCRKREYCSYHKKFCSCCLAKWFGGNCVRAWSHDWRHSRRSSICFLFNFKRLFGGKAGIVTVDDDEDVGEEVELDLSLLFSREGLPRSTRLLRTQSLYNLLNFLEYEF